MGINLTELGNSQIAGKTLFLNVSKKILAFESVDRRKKTVHSIEDMDRMKEQRKEELLSLPELFP